MDGKEIINLEAEIHGITEAEAQERFGLDRSEGILLRVFCAARGGCVVVLLHAYDKGQDPSVKRQRTEIAEARRRLTTVAQRDAITRKSARRVGRRNP